MKRKIGNSWGVGGGGVIHDPSGTEIPRGGGSNRKNHPWEGYGYFLESHNIACVASISVWFQNKRPILAAREVKQEPKNERGGRRRGRRETLADKPLDFENLRSPANAVADWLA